MPKELNFLLLGESGSGKSTTINALANYLKFGEFDEVNKTADSLIEVIPSHFTLPDPENELKMLEIASNLSSPYERQEQGRSTTSKPTGYCFFFSNEDHVLRIIDTPGIGDTDGVEADKRNLEQTFLFLQTIELLHGIIVIVKGNESRHSLQFKFCIIELLTHLHKNAVANVVFCFTHSQIVPGGIGIVHTPGSKTLQFLNKEKDSIWYTFAFGKHKQEKKRQKEIAKLKCTCTEDVTYNEETTSKEVLNENFVQQLNDLKNEIEEKNALLAEHQNTAKELKTEKAMIKEIGSKLAQYINSNSTFIYNNYFETYIDRIIKEKNQKNSPNTIEHDSLKINYQANAARLTESVAANSCQNAANEDVTAEEVLEMQRKLLELKYSGQHFRQVLEKSQAAQVMFERTEKNVFIFRKMTNDFTKLIFKTFFGEEWYSKQHQQSDFMNDNEPNSSFQNENLTLL